MHRRSFHGLLPLCLQGPAARAIANLVYASADRKAAIASAGAICPLVQLLDIRDRQLQVGITMLKQGDLA